MSIQTFVTVLNGDDLLCVEIEIWSEGYDSPGGFDEPPSHSWIEWAFVHDEDEQAITSAEVKHSIQAKAVEEWRLYMAELAEP